MSVRYVVQLKIHTFKMKKYSFHLVSDTETSLIIQHKLKESYPLQIFNYRNTDSTSMVYGNQEEVVYQQQFAIQDMQFGEPSFTYQRQT